MWTKGRKDANDEENSQTFTTTVPSRNRSGQVRPPRQFVEMATEKSPTVNNRQFFKSALLALCAPPQRPQFSCSLSDSLSLFFLTTIVKY